ncbi:MAG: hypothetical protein Q9174_006021 [Haloplaca sp. 1 TL-2023]
MEYENSPFLYKPLKYQDGASLEFRILTLHPGSRDSELSATLSHTSLDGPPIYEALSYVWGNSIQEDDDAEPDNVPRLEKPGAIRLNGHVVMIGQNLHSALQHLRKAVNDRALWVDALCIDQDNMYERGRQVRIMDGTYAKAVSVLAWLGEDDEDTLLAMETIEEICRAVKIRLMDLCALHLTIALADVPDDCILSIEGPTTGMWSDAISGDKKVHFRPLCYTSPAMISTFFWLSHLEPVIETSTTVETNQGGITWTLAEMMRQTRFRSCSRLVDRIFAVLNISSPIAVDPDYEPSPMEIFTDATKAIIEQEQNLNILCLDLNVEESLRTKTAATA